MYCYHCGCKINEKKIENKLSSHSIAIEQEIDSSSKVNYICPRCGHLIHDEASVDDVKSLARASHSELQRGRNFFSKGMATTVLAIILIVTALMFLLISRKPDNQYRITTNVLEFWVFVILSSISVILLVYGIINITLGLKKKIMYEALLKDINNETFYQ